MGLVAVEPMIAGAAKEAHSLEFPTSLVSIALGAKGFMFTKVIAVPATTLEVNGPILNTYLRE